MLIVSVSDWSSVAGMWRGTETLASRNPLTGECQTFVCPDVQLKLFVSSTQSQIWQTYPLNSPCGSGTVVRCACTGRVHGDARAYPYF